MIDSTKFMIHELRCQKINYLCGDCGNVVAKQDKESHVCGDLVDDQPELPQPSSLIEEEEEKVNEDEGLAKLLAT
jgi:hypothetical protein